MNEDVLVQLLGEMLESEFDGYDDPPKWNFSIKHRLAMKRILARFERNAQKLKENTPETTLTTERRKPRSNFKRRMLIALCIIVLMTIPVGWVKAFNAGSIHGKMKKDILQLQGVDLNHGPRTIEYKFALDPVPEGFEITRRVSWTTRVFTEYRNETTDQIILLYQYVRSGYENFYYLEKYAIKNVIINGRPGLYIDFGRDNRHSIVWDNGDYIFEIITDLPDIAELIRK